VGNSEAGNTGLRRSSLFKDKIRNVAAVDNLTVRRERRDERGVISAINVAAFGRPDEAKMVDRLHHEGAVLASFVAELDDQIVGHILFSRMLIETPDVRLAAVALAPIAVRPEQQRLGVGSRLIREGLAWLRARGEHIVIVLGHPDYYGRFGFSIDRAHALASPFPPEAFMALELVPGALDGIRGTVRYPDAFGL
jgi:putative acetyltransferase